MCTAATYKTKDFYFGRTLDHECTYGEEVTITPRNFIFSFRNMGIVKSHYAMIGVAHVAENYPLYYDAVNEKGLAVAGLNFVGNAHYHEIIQDKENIAQFEFIPWILGNCASVREAKHLIEKMNLLNIPFHSRMPVAQLHWMISDRNQTITVEPLAEGIRIYENPVGILTNNPTFEKQLFQLNNYMHLSTKSPQNHFSERLNLKPYSLGMGALGLPGDWSSQSRFVRASFVKMNSISGDAEPQSVSQFFHILGTVAQPRGCCEVGNRKYEITIYTSCCNVDKGIYYYTTYDNHQISGVDLYKEDLDRDDLIRYPLICGEQINMQN